jgi:hypothetical protein
MSVGTVLCVLVVAIVAEPRPVAHVREGLSQGCVNVGGAGSTVSRDGGAATSCNVQRRSVN